jgi:protein involved in polysaccharide export with SLBB domain
MGWRSFLFGFAALIAYCVGAWAEDAASRSDTRPVTAVTLPARNAASADQSVPLRASEGMPRYATMNPPNDDIAAAPTTPVAVAPAGAPQRSAPQPAARAPVIESVTVAGMRPSDDSRYLLGPGDKLHINVYNEADLTGDFAIDGQGFIRLPLVGQVQAAGQTSTSLEVRIAQAFTGGGFLLTPRVSVEIVAYRPFYIIGEVSKPGEYAYVHAMTVPNAIALAGGYTDRAVQSAVLVRRQGDSTEHEFRADENTRILPGDVIRVERTSYWVVMTLLSPLISPFATAAYLLK